MTPAVAVPVSLFFDYTCPFCYLASTRLERLAQRYPLKLRWRFIEIHPNVPVAGHSPAEIGHTPAQWSRINATAAQMAAEDGVPLVERRLIANSRRALLLAQAALELQPARFPALHRSIFHAYFVDGRNIGDPEVLLGLAREQGLAEVAELAWGGPKFYEKLLSHVELAQQLKLAEVPALRVGPRVFTGAGSVQTLEQALKQAGGEHMETP